MATRVFLGRGVIADVAQVETFTVGDDDAATTYTMTIGGQTVSISGTGTGVNDTAAALQVALEAEDHPYFATVDWTVTTDTVTGTSGVAGVPFEATASDEDGTGTIGAGTVTTEAESNHHFMLAANWEGGVAAVNDDDIYIHPNASHICWDLVTGLTGTSLFVHDTTARIGLRKTGFVTSADGLAVDETAPEYRQDYLVLDMVVCIIGIQDGPTVIASPSGRTKIHNNRTTAGRFYVESVRGVSVDTGLPTCRLDARDPDIDVQVVSAIGGCGIGVEPGRTPEFGDIEVLAIDAATRVYVGDNVTLTNYKQSGGNNILGASSGVTSGTVNGGVLTTRFSIASWLLTMLTCNGGTTYLNNGMAGSTIVGTLKGNAGTVVVRGAKTISKLDPQPGFTIIDTDGELTITDALTMPSRPLTISFT